jgi:hypothetical protein
MKNSNLLIIAILLAVCTPGFSQVQTDSADVSQSAIRFLTIEPGVGIHTNFGTDVLLSTLVQWNPRKRVSVAAYSAYSINNVTQRYFNHIRTNYNYSFNQKFGAGTTLFSRRASHTLLLMMGMKYTAFQETLENPNLIRVSTSIKSWNADYGILYSRKHGWKRYFFTTRFYLPLSPWLAKGGRIENVQGTLRDIALEVGMGIRLR